MSRTILYLSMMTLLLALGFAIQAQPALARVEMPYSVQLPAALEQGQEGEAAPKLCVRYDPYFCYNFKEETSAQPAQIFASFELEADQAGEAAPTFCFKYDPYFCYNFKQQERSQPVQIPAILELERRQTGEAAPKSCVKYDPYFCYSFK